MLLNLRQNPESLTVNSKVGPVQGPVAGSQRIESVDMLRGMVMVLMALDHVRDYFHYDAFFFDPTDVEQTNGVLFFTRFITHFCAPVFVFLAGTSAYFVGLKRDKKSLSTWLIKRGIWLVIAELTIIEFAWYFKINFSSIELMVIWVLGISMIFLAFFIHLPKALVIGVSLFVVFGHHLFDRFDRLEPQSDLWAILHHFAFINMGDAVIVVLYPLLPWVFVMALGYYFGELYHRDYPVKRRRTLLWQGGSIMIVLFFVLRYANVYGDPNPWQSYDSAGDTLMSFFNVSKYPPSLLYLLITLGPSLIFLSFAERWKRPALSSIIIFGRVPMFYYILHIFVIHLAAAVAGMLTGYQFSDFVLDIFVIMDPNLKGYGFDLWVVYLVWIAIVVGLYPVCKKYYHYKSRNRDKWWLSYL